MKDIEYILAPMDGITDYPFRNAWKETFGRYSKMQKAVSPFITLVPGQKIKPGHLADVLPANNLMEIEPQVLGKEADSFSVMARALADLGYQTVNWNLGCPMRRVAHKKRGCGLLPYPELIDGFLEKSMSDLPLRLSVKIRLGYYSADEAYKVIEVLNRYPLEYVAVHPRIGKQLYGGAADWDKFAEILPLIKAPVIYNGDIDSVEKVTAFSARFPQINRIMIGRGVISRPFLPCQLSPSGENAAQACGEALGETFKQFVYALWKHYRASSIPETAVLQRQKLFWKSFRGACVPQDGFERVKVMKDINEYEKFLQQYVGI